MLLKINKIYYNNIKNKVEYKEPITNMLIFLTFIILIGVAGYKLFFYFKSFFLNNKFWFAGSLVE